jgi:hypothetical protein
VTAPDFSTVARRRALPRDLALVAAALLLALLSVRAALVAHADRRKALARVEEVRAEVDTAKARLRGLEARGGGGEGPIVQALLTADAPFPRVVAAVAEMLPPDVRLERIGLAYGRELALEIAVVARGPHAFDRLLERLDATPRLRDVRPGPETREGEVRTTVRATWGSKP